MNKSLVSIIIRTLNEGKYLDELIKKIFNQSIPKDNIEIIIVDSGSTDNTLKIASKYSVKIINILKKDFSFGRSLNLGCEHAKGSICVFISGHCIPESKYWLEFLIQPLFDNCFYTYGRQIGRDTTKFSEGMIFDKYYPAFSRIPQKGFFCNNANAAILRSVWQKYKFNEELTGCEDMYLAKQIVNDGGLIGYVSNAPVFHIHNENWKQIFIRYERESIALQTILPELHLTKFDTLKFIILGIMKDCKFALQQKVFFKNFYQIVRFRISQYIGSYVGNKMNRVLSERMKLKYFYPRVTSLDIENEK